MKRSLLLIGLGLLCFPLLAQASEETPRPNIVILYTDDGGWADFGFMPYAADDVADLTPRIDSIAASGVIFDNGYMSGCVCSPSRAGMMTGRYQERFGYDNNLPPGTQNGVSLDETFLAARLGELGYSTALIGKWHLGYPPAYHPNERGFDWFYGLLQGSRPYWPMDNPSPNRVILDNREPTPETGYVTDRFGDAACEFIRERGEEPFFLFLSFTAPHSPLQAKPEFEEQLSSIEGSARRRYAGLVMSADENVGKVLDCLEEEGLSDDTLVVFTNDNGGQTRAGADNGPLHGRKGTLWEGGVRVPWAVRWPGHIEAGTINHNPIISLDLAPTFIEVAGGEVDPSWELDGISLIPTLRTGEALPERPLFWRTHGSNGTRAMRLGDWKLVHEVSEGGNPQLFNLSQDLGESVDLAADQPDQLATMIKQFDSWESELTEPLWGPGSSARGNRGGNRYGNHTHMDDSDE